MSDKPMTREEAEKDLRNKVQAICKAKNLTELEVVRMLATLPAYRRAKEQKAKPE